MNRFANYVHLNDEKGMGRMDRLLTDDQRQMQRQVREFAEKDVKRAVSEMERGHFPIKLIEKMGDLGLLGIPIPAEYGGRGLDFTSYIIAIHELSKISPALGVILSVHTSVGTNPIFLFGTDDQKEKYLPKLARGEYIGAFALTEAHAGSDAKNIALRAKKLKDHYTLDGEKLFVTNGKEADTFITFARTDETQDAARAISAFIVERTNRGLKIGKNEQKMGLYGASTVALQFDRCHVKFDQLLGKEDEGFRIAMANLNIGRIGIAAQALGIAEGAFLVAKRYVKEQFRFITPSEKRHAFTFKLANMKTEIEAAKLLVYQAAQMIENDQKCIKEVSMAKLFAAQTARKVTIDAVQIVGNDSVTEAYDVARFFRDAKVTEIYEGTNEVQRMVIAKRLVQ